MSKQPESAGASPPVRTIQPRATGDMRNTVCVVLGGGKGTRLRPLTEYRSKPAVPLAGKYRLIDIPISNCINSGINRIYLLTQFNSVSLHRHIRQTYNFDLFGGGFVEILAAQQTLDVAAESEGDADRLAWYQGTADAVRKHLRYLQQPGIDYVLIVSGDQLYRMDYRKMLDTHRAANADVTIGSVPVHEQAASAFGIMRLDDTGRVFGFLEKPKSEEELKLVRTDPAWIDRFGVESRGRTCLASMGIYIFNRDTLVELLSKSNYHDFGKEIFPMAMRTRHVQVHMFDGYWEDIGTIRAFYDANLALAGEKPPFEFVGDHSTIYTRPRFLPPNRIHGATVRRSLIADGCVIEEGAVIENSIIGLRCHIGRDVQIRNTILMGNDFYQDEPQREKDFAAGDVPVGIGAGSVIEGAIVDKNCRVGRQVTIRINETGDRTHDPVVISDGVAVVPKGAVLPDGYSLTS